MAVPMQAQLLEGYKYCNYNLTGIRVEMHQVYLHLYSCPYRCSAAAAGRMKAGRKAAGHKMAGRRAAVRQAADKS